MDKRKIGLIVVFFSLLLIGNQVFGAGFQQLINDTKSTTQAISFGQDLGFGNGDTINQIKLYLEPFDDGTGSYFKVQLWSDVSVDIWTNNVAIGEIGVKELYTFDFPTPVELLVGEEFGFAVDTTGNKNFHIYGASTDVWVGGDGWDGGLAPVVDLYFDLDFFEEPPPVLSYLTIPAQLPADMLAYSGNLFTDLGLLITMTAGLPIGFKVIKRIIALVKVR